MNWILLFCLAAMVTPAGLGGATEVPGAKPNRLIDESSPYLQLHAYNPVDWYPWGDVALQKARDEDLPIFLSVGYTTCYWCHVMEREVFSDPEIAELMNQWFVNIKVDREERPDIDEIYMTTTQLLTGRGGWPNSVFLTPELEPFFAGTYFPPEDRHGRPGFKTVLTGLHEAWLKRRPEVEDQASQISTRVRQAMAGADKPASAISAGSSDEVMNSLSDRFDQENGGFGSAPKFPTPSNLFFLWDAAEQGDPRARSMVVQSLAGMGRGAIYDHLDGGFHRYTLDAAWRIPHFEKMLYDNAFLAELLTMAAAATRDPNLEFLARGTLEFLLTEMRLPNGAFKSAIDAETDGVEGAFYIWTQTEVKSLLSQEELDFIAPIFGLDGPANFENEHHTLYLTSSLSSHAKRLGIDEVDLRARLLPLLARLRDARALRPFPIVDDKVLTDWNGMAISAFARAGQIFEEKRYLEVAREAAKFLSTMKDSNGVQLHVWRNGVSRLPGFLDDYAFLVRGLLTLYEATGEKTWLQSSEQLVDEMDRRLGAPGGGFYLTGPDSNLIVRPVTASDGSIPSGNGVAILNLVRLAELTGKPAYLARADLATRAFGDELARAPAAFTTLALAAQAVSRAGLADTGLERIDKLAENLVVASLSTATAEDRDGRQDFVLVLQIREGWHVNANPASQEYLIPTRVEGEVQDVIYPQGESLKFGFSEERISVYSDSVEIVGAMSSHTSSVRLTYQACDDRRCLPPVSRDLSVSPRPVEVEQ